MESAVPFSKIDKYLEGIEGSVSGCIVDTQFLIAATEELHNFSEDAEFLFEKLTEYRIPVFTTVTTRSEYIDYRRRRIMTETLMDMLSPESPWRISESVKTELRKHKSWIDSQAKQEKIPLLTDVRIKSCKELFMTKSQSGQIGWIALCEEFLKGQLLQTWEEIVKELGLNYVDMRSERFSQYMVRPLKWEKMYEIGETTALSSSDSMILNALYSSSFPFIVSADYDLAYALLAKPEEKTILIPDNLYFKKIKSLRF